MKKILILLIVILISEVVYAQLPAYLPSEGLVGWWPFNGSANDESGYGHDGMNPIGTFGTDRFGNSNASFYGNGLGPLPGSGMYISNINNFPFGNSNRSVSVWFKCDIPYPGGSRELFCYGDNTLGTRFGIFLDGASIGVEYVNGAVTGNFLPDENWHNLVATYNGEGSSGIILYLDAHVIATSVNIPLSTLNTTNSFVKSIGRLNDIYNFAGSYDDVGLWNRVLTAEEITALYTGAPVGSGSSNTASANVPQGISYQAVARDVQGQALSNSNLQVRFTLLADSLNGTIEYIDLHNLITNEFGLFNTVFGSRIPQTGSFSTTQWAAGNKYLKVEINAGNGFEDIGTQQLLSVPYAIRSKSAGEIENDSLPVYPDNTAAAAGGLTPGKIYRTAAGDLKVVY